MNSENTWMATMPAPGATPLTVPMPPTTVGVPATMPATWVPWSQALA